MILAGEFNNPVIGPAWAGRFFSSRGIAFLLRGEMPASSNRPGLSGVVLS
jgi:hypothetical protein